MLPERAHAYQHTCQQFVDCVTQHMPEYCKRLKIHILLHLVDDMLDFGPTACYSTERYNIIHVYNVIRLYSYFRYESFNSLMRGQNICGNRHAPSRDIAKNFAVIEYLRLLGSGGVYNHDHGTRSVLFGLAWLPVSCITSI